MTTEDDRRVVSALSEGLGPLEQIAVLNYTRYCVGVAVATENERCAALVESRAGMRGTGAWVALTAAADAIRGPNVPHKRARLGVDD